MNIWDYRKKKPILDYCILLPDKDVLAQGTVDKTPAFPLSGLTADLGLIYTMQSHF